MPKEKQEKDYILQIKKVIKSFDPNGYEEGVSYFLGIQEDDMVYFAPLKETLRKVFNQKDPNSTALRKRAERYGFLENESKRRLKDLNIWGKDNNINFKNQVRPKILFLHDDKKIHEAIKSLVNAEKILRENTVKNGNEASQGAIGEYYSQKIFKAKKKTQNKRGYDLECSNGSKIEVKTKRPSPSNSNCLEIGEGKIKGKDICDLLCLILLNEDYSIKKITILSPKEFLQKRPKISKQGTRQPGYEFDFNKYPKFTIETKKDLNKHPHKNMVLDKDYLKSLIKD